MKGVTGENHPSWKGGERINKCGYLIRTVYSHPHKNTSGTVPVHRLVYERMLGRYLKPKEKVHHINGNKLDNRIENLQWLPNLSYHNKVHWLQRKLGLRNCEKEIGKVVCGL